MKAKSFIAMSMIAALAVGCSSDDLGVDGDDNSNGSITEGKAYVAMNISLPSVNGTRSENDDFNAGKPEEYAVKSLKIYFFSKLNGKEKGFVTYEIDKLLWETAGSGITSKVVLPIQEVDFVGQVYAVAEINGEGADLNLGVDEIKKLNTESQSPTVKSLIGGDDDHGFFMTNAVLKDGTTWVEVEACKSKDEAQKKAKDIYVERAVAKVEMDAASEGWTADGDGNKTYSITGTDKVNAGAKVKVTGWKLDVTNKKMYPVRKFSAISFDKEVYHRFFSASNDYRTYWAEDPNYAEDATEGSFNSATAIDNKLGTTPEYCLENTFDVARQKHSETTRALVKAVYTPKDFNEGDTWYTLGNSATALTEEQVRAKIAKELSTETTPLTKDNIALVSNLAAGEHKFENGGIFTVNSKASDPDQNAAIKKSLGSIIVYADGVCYYEIRIKHLDHYCPWGDEAGAPTYHNTEYIDYVHIPAKKEELPGYDVSYLGRYGVVRNNWYQISITSISQPGEPTIPALNDKCDDEQKYYLQANINILEWAVRHQAVEL